MGEEGRESGTSGKRRSGANRQRQRQRQREKERQKMTKTLSFAEIGKAAKDLLSGGFQLNQKLTASTKTESGVEFTVSGVKKDDKLDGDIKVAYKTSCYSYKCALLCVDKGNTYKASYVHAVSGTSSVGGEVVRNLAKESTTFTVGAT